MALKLRLYSFNKRINSTKSVGSINPLLEVNVTIKDGTSAINPTFMLVSAYNDNLIANANYCDIYDTDETSEIYYAYFINDKIINNGYIELECTEDVLATFKGQIANYDGYCVRSSDSNRINPLIPDNIYNSQFYKRVIDQDSVVAWFGSGGAYVVGIAGLAFDGSQADTICQRGSVTYLLMDDEDLTELCETLVQHSVGEQNFDMLQYIVSCVYIPRPISELWGTDTGRPNPHKASYSVKIGVGGLIEIDISFVIAGNALRNNNGVYHRAINLSFTIPTQATSARKYLAYEPYASYSLYLGGFGLTAIPSEYMQPNFTNHEANNITIYMDIDVCTGAGVMEIRTDSASNLIHAVKSQIGVSVQLSQGNGNSLIGTALANWGENFSGLNLTSEAMFGKLGAKLAGLSESVNNFIGVTGEAIRGVGDALNNSSRKMSHSGSTGSFAEYYDDNIHCITEYLPVVTPDFEAYGAPVCESLTVSQFTTGSYIEFDRPDFSSAYCMKSEIDAINSFLSNGFFYE